MPNQTRLFIYGTLKRGQVNNYLLESETYLGEAETTPDFRLLKLGWYPGMAAVKKEGVSIKGEIWEVSETCLQALDVYEGDEYERKEIRLAADDTEIPIQTYLLHTPDWSLPDAGTQWN
ncbi:MAG: gamma-glutamylaminecyclotransferase [Verrucomicrobiales bacterium]|jgi:gamma-glutamylaminecyclotransferase